MRSSLRIIAVAMCATILAACATNGEVKGQRTASIAATPSVQRVDVLFVDQPSLKLAGVQALLPWNSSNFMQIESAQREVRDAFSEARRGVELALAANGIPGRSYLQSVPQPGHAPAASHVVLVTIRSLTRNNTAMHAVTDIRVYDMQTRQVVWSGEAVLPGGFILNNTETQQRVRQTFGQGVVRALQEIGLATAGKAAASQAS